MPKISILFGVLLIIVGVAGFAISGMHAPTALIPSAIGIILCLCGILVIFNEKLRKHVMHVAALVGLLGAVGSGMRATPQIPALIHGTAKLPVATVSQLVTALLCVLFVIFCVKSFIDARRKR